MNGHEEVVTSHGRRAGAHHVCRAGQRVDRLCHALTGWASSGRSRPRRSPGTRSATFELTLAAPAWARADTLIHRLFQSSCATSFEHADDRLMFLRSVAALGVGRERGERSIGSSSRDDYEQLLADQPRTASSIPVARRRSAAGSATRAAHRQPQGVLYSHRSNVLPRHGPVPQPTAPA